MPHLPSTRKTRRRLTTTSRRPGAWRPEAPRRRCARKNFSGASRMSVKESRFDLTSSLRESFVGFGGDLGACLGEAVFGLPGGLLSTMALMVRGARRRLARPGAAASCRGLGRGAGARAGRPQRQAAARRRAPPVRLAGDGSCRAGEPGRIGARAGGMAPKAQEGLPVASGDLDSAPNKPRGEEGGFEWPRERSRSLRKAPQSSAN